ncbi:unnamed protein product [Lepeophtheirus salmonis]|uniref:(salmon louse) hypothetical protein n=1 Tax=Lepeophtheirus salmonis TaxID=72036 RepID=A0A7R8CUF7_LEPSM|nr:unnamed protein product [Lepeophtheirus salmonis]CAF2935727.1 unnamed protein product [Lepeophtheirus salmonis]
MASTFRIVRGFATSKEGVTKLPNGLSVLSVPECTGVGYLRMSVLGGSRYERYENLGSSHALRGIQQSGANFDISQGREIMSYSLTSSRKTIPSLSDINLSPAYMAQELLYKAAFRTGIGNSIYSPSFMVGSHNSAMLKGFFDKTFALDRATLIGCGISHESLLQIAECINLPSASTTKTTASTFYGGECRSELNGQHAHIAMGFPGSSYASSEKERISALLYQRILGVGSRVKRGVGLGRLNKVLEAGQSLRKVIQVFKNPKITDAEVKAAKKNVIADLSEAYLNPSSLCNILEEQILLGGGKIQDNSKAVEDSINSVTIADVQTFAKKISGSPLSMGAIGNLEHLPYLDEFTYIKMSMLMLYLPGFCLYSPWRFQCENITRNRTHRRYNLVGGSEEEINPSDAEFAEEEDDENSLSHPVFLPVNHSTDDSEPETATTMSKKKSVRFSRVAEIRQMSGAYALHANIARLSYQASLRAQAALRRAASRLTLKEVAGLALTFTIPFFLGNFCYQMALKTQKPFFAVCFSIAGVVLVSFSDLQQELTVVPYGALWALAGSVCYSCYIVFLRRKVDHEDKLDAPIRPSASLSNGNAYVFDRQERESLINQEDFGRDDDDQES